MRNCWSESNGPGEQDGQRLEFYADPTGFLVSHPWVNAQLARRLGHWAFKVATAGGLEFAAFALR